MPKTTRTGGGTNGWRRAEAPPVPPAPAPVAVTPVALPPAPEPVPEPEPVQAIRSVTVASPRRPAPDEAA